MSNARLDSGGFARGTYLYGQLTPLVILEGRDDARLGLRASIGVTSPGFSRTLWPDWPVIESKSNYDDSVPMGLLDIFVVRPLAALLFPFNHYEVAYQVDGDGVTSFSFLLGGGL